MSVVTTVVVFLASMVLGECRQMSASSQIGNDSFQLQVTLCTCCPCARPQRGSIQKWVTHLCGLLIAACCLPSPPPRPCQSAERGPWEPVPEERVGDALFPSDVDSQPSQSGTLSPSLFLLNKINWGRAQEADHRFFDEPQLPLLPLQPRKVPPASQL